MPCVRALKMRFCMTRPVVLVEARRHVGDELAHHLLPAVRQVLRDAADAEPARVHAGAADGLDDAEGLLAVGEHVEHGRKRADVAGEGAVPDEVADDAEELGTS